MKYDKPLIAVLFGMTVVIPLEVYTQIFKNMGLTHISCFELTSMMLYREGSWLLGLLTCAGTGGLAGLVIYQATRVMGTDYLFFKGAGLGMITYAWVVIIFGILGRNSNLEQPISGHYVHAIGAALAGGAAGLLMKKYLFSKELVANDTHQKKESHRYIIVSAPAKKREKKVRFIKPKKL